MKPRLAAAAVAALSAVVLLAGSVHAAPRSAVSITLVRDGNDLSEISWSASGAIVDGGSWTTENRHYGGSDHSKAFVVTQVLTTQVGAGGSFQLRFQGIENPVIDFGGNWQLYGGTGAYRGMTGTGHWYVAFDSDTANLDFILTGFVR